LAETVSPDKIRRLSPAEMRRFNLESGALETPWRTGQTGSGQFYIFKSISGSEDSIDGGRTIRVNTTSIRIGCHVASNFIMRYRQEFSMPAGHAIVRGADGESKQFRLTKASGGGVEGEISMSLEFLQRAGSQPYLEIADAAILASERNAQVTRVSTSGLSAALEALRQQCDPAVTINLPAPPAAAPLMLGN
jgi:hypothetical protein